MQIHVSDIKASAQKAQTDAKWRQQLFCIMAEGTSREAATAAWTLTHLPKDCNKHIENNKAMIVNVATHTDSTTIRRLALTLLERMEWPEGDICILDWCLEHMMIGDEPYGVRSLCIKLAHKQCRHYPELCEELRQTLMLMDPADMGPGLKHTWKKTLAEIGERHSVEP